MEGIEYQKNMHIDMLSEPNDLEIWVCVCREVWLWTISLVGKEWKGQSVFTLWL